MTKLSDYCHGTVRGFITKAHFRKKLFYWADLCIRRIKMQKQRRCELRFEFGETYLMKIYPKKISRLYKKFKKKLSESLSTIWQLFIKWNFRLAINKLLQPLVSIARFSKNRSLACVIQTFRDLNWKKFDKIEIIFFGWIDPVCMVFTTQWAVYNIREWIPRVSLLLRWLIFC